jgi:hypothetical protein
VSTFLLHLRRLRAINKYCVALFSCHTTRTIEYIHFAKIAIYRSRQKSFASDQKTTLAANCKKISTNKEALFKPFFTDIKLFEVVSLFAQKRPKNIFCEVCNFLPSVYKCDPAAGQKISDACVQK